MGAGLTAALTTAQILAQLKAQKDKQRAESMQEGMKTAAQGVGKEGSALDRLMDVYKSAYLGGGR